MYFKCWICDRSQKLIFLRANIVIKQLLRHTAMKVFSRADSLKAENDAAYQKRLRSYNNSSSSSGFRPNWRKRSANCSAFRLAWAASCLAIIARSVAAAASSVGAGIYSPAKVNHLNHNFSISRNEPCHKPKLKSISGINRYPLVKFIGS